MSDPDWSFASVASCMYSLLRASQSPLDLAVPLGSRSLWQLVCPTSQKQELPGQLTLHVASRGERMSGVVAQAVLYSCIRHSFEVQQVALRRK